MMSHHVTCHVTVVSHAFSLSKRKRKRKQNQYKIRKIKEKKIKLLVVIGCFGHEQFLFSSSFIF